MNPKEQELMERYIYQVVRRLPREQRQEVGLELQELIGDMREHGTSMEDVLTKLGNPAEFAGRYQDAPHFLIGPEYYDNYIWFMKIALICTMIAVLAASVIEGVRTGVGQSDENMLQAVITAIIYGCVNGISNLMVSCISVFGGITLMFAVMERNKTAFDMKKEKQWTVNDLGDNFTGNKMWSPSSLSPVPHKKAMISRGDTIVGIVFIVILGVLLIFAPGIFSVVLGKGEEAVFVPVFNLDKWNIILPVFILSLVIGLADEVFRLIVGHYCKPVMISNLVCGLVQMFLTIIVLKVLPFWNLDFTAEIKARMGEQLSSSAEFVIDKWNGDFVSNFLVIVCLMITMLEIGTTVYYTLRYGGRSVR